MSTRCEAWSRLVARAVRDRRDVSAAEPPRWANGEGGAVLLRQTRLIWSEG